VKVVRAIVCLTILIAPHTIAHAATEGDIGPAPPSMLFALHFESTRSPILRIELFVCDAPACAGRQAFADPPGWFGRPAAIGCDENRCWAFAGAVDFGRYHQLVLTFADGARESNVFTKVAYAAEYQVDVGQDALSVREVTPNSFLDYFSPLQSLLFAPALVLTLTSEAAVARMYSKRVPLRVRSAIYANLISFPVVWLVLPFLRLSFPALFAAAEAFAIAFEGVFLRVTNRNRGLALKDSFLASTLMNLASVLSGGAAILVIPLAFGILDRLG
jgi:hypothetical protein